MQPENNGPEGQRLETAVKEVTEVEARPIANEPVKSDIVFNDKPKKSGGMILCMILLALLAAGGIGFGVWAMLDGNAQKDTLNQQISTLKSQIDELQEKINDNVSNSTDSDTDINDSWSKYSRNLATQDIHIGGNYWHYNGTDNERYIAFASKDENGHLTVTDAGNNMNTDNPIILELDDVLSVYYVQVGNGGVPYFYIVDLNGSVSRIDISENSSRQLEKVGDYTKIVNVFVPAGLEAVLIDIDGNIYKSY